LQQKNYYRWQSPKIGGASEKLKQVCFFARLALSLQFN